MKENKNNNQSQGGGGNWWAILFILLIVLIIISIRDQKQLAQEDKDNTLSANKKNPQIESVLGLPTAVSANVSWSHHVLSLYCWINNLIESPPLNTSNVDELKSIQRLLSLRLECMASDPGYQLLWSNKYLAFDKWNLDIKNNLLDQTSELLDGRPQHITYAPDLREVHDLARKFVNRMNS